jgi:signal transduction histidine kinase
VVEHAYARQVVITLTYQADVVTLDVRDDGRGFDPSARSPSGSRGRGLAGIRSRTRALGGALAVESAPGEGTAIALSLPLPSQPSVRVSSVPVPADVTRGNVTPGNVTPGNVR